MLGTELSVLLFGFGDGHPITYRFRMNKWERYIHGPLNENTIYHFLLKAWENGREFVSKNMYWEKSTNILDSDRYEEVWMLVWTMDDSVQWKKDSI